MFFVQMYLTDQRLNERDKYVRKCANVLDKN